jgi:ATP-dependent Clp protease ATP-binding subunit ClpA
LRRHARSAWQGIVEGIAQRIVRGDVPESLKNKKLVSLDMGALVAGAKFRGEFEDRLKAVLKEVEAGAGQKLLRLEDELRKRVVGQEEALMAVANASEDRKSLIQRAVIEDVRKAFRPEFLNRLDETVVFNLLAREDVHAIVDIQLRRFATRLAKREIFVELSPAAKDFLAETGWDPHYGARPLKRAIQRSLEDPLAKHVIAGEYVPGTHLVVDLGADGQLVFTTRPPS